MQSLRDVMPTRLRHLIGRAVKRAPPEKFAGHYADWRRKRIAAMTAAFGGAQWFAGKRGLEVGCGYADIGGHFAGLGADMLCTDARAEHLAVAKRRYPGIDVQVVDLDRGFPAGRYDFVLHLGVLYHLADPLADLRAAVRSLQGAALVLETEVCNVALDDFVLYVGEHGYDQALEGVGGRASEVAVERVFADEGLPFVRLDDATCNSTVHVYDWRAKDTRVTWYPGMRRLWFVGEHFRQAATQGTLKAVPAAS